MQRIRLLVFCVLFTVITFGLIASGHAQGPTQTHTPPLPFVDNWQYRWGDSPKNDAGLPVWIFDADDSSAWQDLPELTQPPARNDEQILWMRVKLPNQSWPDASLFFDSTDQGLEAYLNQYLIYQANDIDAIVSGRGLGTAHHLIRLPTDFQNKFLYLRIYSEYTAIGLRSDVMIGSRADHIMGIINRDIERFILIPIFIFIGLTAFILFLSRPEQKAYLGLAIFTLSSGLFTLFRTQFVELFTQNSVLQDYTKIPGVFMVPVGLALFFEYVISPGKWFIVRRIWQVHLTYTLLAVGLSIVGIVPLLSTVAPFYGLVVPSIIILIVTALVEAWRGNLDARYFVLGCTFVLMGGIPDILDDIRVLYLPRRLSHWGILGFILMQAFILTQQFARVHRQLQTYSQELESKSQELERKNESLSELDKLKDEFLANTSHELRTPLNGIIGLAESLLDGATGDLPVETKTNMAMIVSSGKRLASLINDILDFTKLRHQTLNLQCKPIHMHALAEVVLALSQPLVGQKPIQLINQINPEHDLVWADENRVQQIMYNLIGNAIKFTEKGQITISTKLMDAATPQTASNGPEKFLAISIKDTGVGISPEKYEQIFQSFEQGDGSIARQYGGTGLGLAVTKNLVILHQGAIWVHSEVNKGSVFTFTLPLLKKLQGEGSEAAKSIDPSLDLYPTLSVQTLVNQPELEYATLVAENLANKDRHQAKYHVLIVDDEPINVQVLRNYLSIQGYRMTACTDGLEALRAVREDGPFDLILLDVMMPRMSGYEVCQILRETYSLSQLPILMLTAKNQARDIVAGFDAGANDYLTKPIDKQELLARIETLLTLKHAVVAQSQLIALHHELEVAQRIQQDLLPPPTPHWAKLDMRCYSTPADEVGGDFYYYYTWGRGQDKRYAMAVGDISGKGISAALLMATSISQVDATRFLALSPTERLVHLDTTIMPYTLSRGQNCALVYAELTIGEIITLEVVNAGCIPPYIKRRDGTVVWLEVGGFALGQGLGMRHGYQEEIATLNRGDTVILTSDGLAEAKNADNEMFGFERVEAVIKSAPQTDAQGMLNHLLKEVRTFMGKSPLKDDMTIVILKV